METLLGMAPIVLLFVVFYFLLIRPQQKQQKKRQEMLSSLKKGNKVITIGGFYGIIKELREEDLTLKIGDNMDVRMTRLSIDRILEDE